MEIFNRLPEELKYIVHRLDASHRENFHPTLVAIPLAGIRSRLARFKKLCINQSMNPSMNQSVNQSINVLLNLSINRTITDPEHFVIVLSTCRCCTRHQTNRPKNIHDRNFPEYGCIRIPKKGEFVEMCECDCRSMSRTMCRI